MLHDPTLLLLLHVTSCSKLLCVFASYIASCTFALVVLESFVSCQLDSPDAACLLFPNPMDPARCCGSQMTVQLTLPCLSKAMSGAGGTLRLQGRSGEPSVISQDNPGMHPTRQLVVQALLVAPKVRLHRQEQRPSSNSSSPGNSSKNISGSISSSGISSVLMMVPGLGLKIGKVSSRGQSSMLQAQALPASAKHAKQWMIHSTAVTAVSGLYLKTDNFLL